MMSYPSIIAIDGPAASGKSTLALQLANFLNYLFFDTGVMYRAVTLAALKKNLAISDEIAITAVAERIQIDVQPPSIADGRLYDVIVDGEDLTWELRQPEVDADVSQVSAYPGVRTALTGQQRRIGLRGNVVMVGRDIGTVVFPDAEFKLYLDASVEERARRRYMEVLSRGDEARYESILASMRRRDKIDSTRTVAPLYPAQDAVIINTDGMNLNQVFDKVKDILPR